MDPKAILMFILSKLVNADLIGGWVRAFVSAGLGLLVAKIPFVQTLIVMSVCPTVQTAQVPCDFSTAEGIISVAIAGVIVGIWQQVAKAWTSPTATQTTLVMQNAADKNLVSQEVATAVKADPSIAMPVDVAKGGA